MSPLRPSDKGLEIWGWKKGRAGVGKQERRKHRKLWPEGLPCDSKFGEELLTASFRARFRREKIPRSLPAAGNPQVMP